MNHREREALDRHITGNYGEDQFKGCTDQQWVYVQSEPGLWTVGFYDPDGEWQSDSDHSDREPAAKRVHYLNGGN